MKFNDAELKRMSRQNESYIPKYIIQEIISTLDECASELEHAGSDNTETINRAKYLKSLLIQKLIYRG